MSKRTLAILFGVLALVGLADAVYMTWDHYQHAIDPSYAGGLCGIKSGCDISRGESGEILSGALTPGVPLAVLAIGFYVAFLLLTWFRLRRPQDVAPRRIQLGLAALATLYSISLAVYSLAVQGALCKLCAVMYVVNVLLLFVAWRARAEPIGAWFKGVWGAIPKLTTAAVTAVFLAAVVVIYALYAHRVGEVLAAQVQPEVKTSLKTDGRPSKGPEDAPVQIVEFADLQCPHCSQLFSAVEEVQAARPDEVRVTFIHFPLDKACNPALKQDFHPNACWLAAVSDCAGRQGKFFEVTKLLFEKQRASSNDELLALVKGLGVDGAALDACMADAGTGERILADIKQGLALEINGTPVFFINGRRMSGSRPPEVLNELVDEALKDASTR
ncbi:MAG: hypothetical protein EP329_13025 [Deltaproteobacteria bacterium]|nr:MAG: hypothetical protein EP329_13025 [Deltaproteobacteria bacterium]